MKNDGERLLDIMEAIERIERYTAGGREAFYGDELIQVWAIHHLQAIGEAARNVSDALRATYPEIPWASIVAMRNVLVHDYLDVDLDEVWATVEHDLPDLKQKIAAILNELETNLK